MSKTIGILYLCTGPYKLFWDDYYNSFEKNFLPGISKHYYVFTDSVDYDFEKYKNSTNVSLIHIDAMPWPLITLLRFHYFLSIRSQLEKHDYLLFTNANIVCNEIVISDEFLPRVEKGEELSYCQHPGYFQKRGVFNFPYERRKKSLAYIPYNCGSEYVIGALFAGTKDAFLNMSVVLNNRIEEDLKHNVIARWHDESHLNRYIVGKENYRLLSPSFCYPVGFDLPVNKKIAGVSKIEKFDVNSFKGYSKQENQFIQFVTRAKKRIKNEGFIWLIKDTLMMKKVKKI